MATKTKRKTKKKTSKAVPKKTQRRKTNPEHRERRAARAKEDIIAGAARAFAQSGYKATTMRAIAKEAGFTASSLYQYFQNKEEIVGELIMSTIEQVLAIFDRPVPSGLDFRARLELLLLRQNELVEDRRDAFSFLHSLSTSGAPLPKSLRKTDHEPNLYATRLGAWLKDNAGKGDIGKYSTEDAGYFLWGAQHAVFVRWLQGNQKGRLSDHVSSILDFFLFGVQGTPRA